MTRARLTLSLGQTRMQTTSQIGQSEDIQAPEVSEKIPVQASQLRPLSCKDGHGQKKPG
ncbi:uncharacterized protein FFB20_02302 [Fusarium fujikuroi]|nr:uncharacterized protein FFB20_02302 [Fusarium fujikuroi]SCN99026.1 uncharacterized protein FFE2_09220 [Fusarium fujikuroi]SCO08012.1 uncharacterized protein FFC1_10603 [Fusarium fujikuroi]SCO44235.1 uncharacterized protein FFNC_09708 [Fusarium fujikuroi]SCV49575.1 uncharacterized protein FFFS_09111 [Fusarium fujikuroi]